MKTAQTPAAQPTQSAQSAHTPTDNLSPCTEIGQLCEANAAWNGHYRTPDGRIFDRNGQMTVAPETHARLTAERDQLRAALRDMVLVNPKGPAADRARAALAGGAKAA